MNKDGSGTRITEAIRKIIYKCWEMHQSDLEKNDKKTLNIKRLLYDVNNEIIKSKLRLKGISKSQLYVEIKKFKTNKDNIEPSLDSPFNLATFNREYGNKVDAEAIKYILLILKHYEVEYADEERTHVISNRQALWISKLYRWVIDTFDEEDTFIDGFVFPTDDDTPADETEPNTDDDTSADETEHDADNKNTGHPVKGNIWALEEISRCYALLEKMFEILGEPFNSSKLDYALTKSNYVDWQRAFFEFLYDQAEYAVETGKDKFFIEALKKDGGQ